MKKATTKNRKKAKKTHTVPPEELMPAYRLGMRIGSFNLECFTKEDSPWFETKREIEAGLEAGHQKQIKLDAIREEMRNCLKPIDVRIIELRFFSGYTLKEVGKKVNRDASTVQRHIRRAIHLLKIHFDLHD